MNLKQFEQGLFKDDPEFKKYYNKFHLDLWLEELWFKVKIFKMELLHKFGICSYNKSHPHQCLICGWLKYKEGNKESAQDVRET